MGEVNENILNQFNISKDEVKSPLIERITEHLKSEKIVTEEKEPETVSFKVGSLGDTNYSFQPEVSWDHPDVDNYGNSYVSNFKNGRAATIKPMNNGFVLEVGCQSFVFESFTNMMEILDRYYKDPSGIEKLFNEGKLFNK